MHENNINWNEEVDMSKFEGISLDSILESYYQNSGNSPGKGTLKMKLAEITSAKPDSKNEELLPHPILSNIANISEDSESENESSTNRGEPDISTTRTEPLKKLHNYGIGNSLLWELYSPRNEEKPMNYYKISNTVPELWPFVGDLLNKHANC